MSELGSTVLGDAMKMGRHQMVLEHLEATTLYTGQHPIWASSHYLDLQGMIQCNVLAVVTYTP